MKIYYSYLLRFLLIWVIVAGADAQTPLSLKARAERGLQRADLQTFLDASKEDPTSVEVGSAIVATGRTDDPFWVPYLKPFLKYGRDRNPNLSSLADAAQLALAKLGEQEQLQEIGCEVEFGSSSLKALAVEQKLKYVRGWFSISLLAGWVDESYKENQLLLDLPGDAIELRPQELALDELPKIVSNPPFSAPVHNWMATREDAKLAPFRQGWREWISKNEASLRKLTPTGDGLDLSVSSCKRVLAHDQHLDRNTRYNRSHLK